MISVLQFAATGTGFQAQAAEALAVLAERPGFLRGSVGRSTDEADAWVLVTEWENVGSYRRALGNYDVKVRATPVLAAALDRPTSFETLAESAGGVVTTHASDREG